MAEISGQKITREKIIVVLLLLGILFLGNKLRFYNYGLVPHPGETADEYVFAWAGLSLIQKGIPESWTGVKNAYPKINFQKINVDGIYDADPERPPFSLVSPWFDKPPGFALLVGAYSYVKGAKEFIQTGVGIIRRPMVRIAIVTTLLIFVLGYRLYGPFVGILSALLYSVVPTMVISSRLTLSENAYIPIFLGALILSDIYLEKRKKIYWILAALLSSLGIIFKLSAFSILLALFLIFAFYVPKARKRKVLVGTFLIGMLGFLVFIAYGAIYDWATFVKVFFAQSNLLYGAGAEVLFSAITSSKVTATKFFTDGWITLGWISLLAISILEFKKEKGGTVLTFAAFSYLTIFLIFGSEGYGWYRFPFFPFLAIATARVFEKLFSAPNIFVATALSLLPFGTTVHKLLGLEGFQPYVVHFRLFVLLAIALVGLSFFTKDVALENVKKAYIIFLIGTLIFLSIKLVYFYNYDNWFFVT